MSELNQKYEMFFDDKLWGQGVIIVAKEGKKFLKIFSSNNNGFPWYEIIAMDLEEYDERKLDVPEVGYFFEDIFEIGKTEKAYEAIERLHEKLGDRKIVTAKSDSDCKSYFQVRKSDNGFEMVVAEDWYNTRNVAPEKIVIELGDHIYPYWSDINSFYKNLLEEVDVKKPLDDQTIERLIYIRRK